MTHIDQLHAILNSSGWSQERLAQELGVSFVSLNAWLNKRAVPRRKAVQRIETLYLNIVGVEAVDNAELLAGIKRAKNSKLTASALVKNQAMLDKLTLHLTYHTNTIEGSTMTLSDVQDVIFEQKTLSNRTAIEQAEARNHQAALYWLLDKMAESGGNFTIDEQIILGLHLRLMNGIISDAGTYRKHAVRILGAHVTLANWQKVPELVHEHANLLQKQPSDIIETLAKTHASFEKIHPFTDGNGRVGRLLLLAQALQNGLVPPLIAKERRQAYYKYLELAQTKDDYKPLELFITQSMAFAAKILKS